MRKIIVANTEKIIQVYTESHKTTINIVALVTILLVNSYVGRQKDRVDICCLPVWIIFGY